MAKGYKKEADKTLPIGPGKGCIYAPDCTKCPFPLFDGVCLYYLTPIKREALFAKKDFRNEVIYKGFLAGGDIEDYKKIFNLSGKYLRSLISREYKRRRSEDCNA